MKLGERLRALAATGDALSLRERLALFAAVVVVIGGACEGVLGSALAAREAEARARIEAAEERLRSLNESVALVVEGIDTGVGDQAERLRQLRRSVSQSEETMRLYTSDLVAPDQMRFVLEDLLRRHDGLKLVSATNLDARPLIEPNDDSTASEDSGEPLVFRHGVTLEFEGSYLETLAYLDAVESLPWQLFWSRVALETIEYPWLHILLEVQTLSLDEEWIGV